MENNVIKSNESTVPALFSKTPWVRPRHRYWKSVGLFFMKPLAKLKYGADMVKYPSGEQVLILFNHQTPYDQVFVEASFRQHVYFVATENIFSMGFASTLINMTVAPIPIRKSVRDIRAVRYCLRVAAEGGSIAMAPEGNRTFSGKTGDIRPAVVSLARHIKLPILLYRIEGGFGVQPRWSDKRRRGKMRCGVYKRISPEEYGSMTDEELYKVICDGLAIDENVSVNKYKGRAEAEYIERALYTCPYCGLSVFESKGNIFRCKKCGREFRYLPTNEIEGIGFKSPYGSMGEWYDAQCDFVHRFDPETYVDKPMFMDRVDVYEVFVYKNKKKIAECCTMRLYGNRAELDMPYGTMLLDFDDTVTSAAVLGRNKLNLYLKDGRLLQFRGGDGDKRFNALKYVNFYYHFVNVKKGLNDDGEFLGL